MQYKILLLIFFSFSLFSIEKLTLISTEGFEYEVSKEIALQSKMIEAAYDNGDELRISTLIENKILRDLIRAMDMIYAEKQLYEYEFRKQCCYYIPERLLLSHLFFNHITIENFSKELKKAIIFLQEAIKLEFKILERVIAVNIAKACKQYLSMQPSSVIEIICCGKRILNRTLCCRQRVDPDMIYDLLDNICPDHSDMVWEVFAKLPDF